MERATEGKGMERGGKSREVRRGEQNWGGGVRIIGFKGDRRPCS